MSDTQCKYEYTIEYQTYSPISVDELVGVQVSLAPLYLIHLLLSLEAPPPHKRTVPSAIKCSWLISFSVGPSCGKKMYSSFKKSHLGFICDNELPLEGKRAGRKRVESPKLTERLAPWRQVGSGCVVGEKDMNCTWLPTTIRNGCLPVCKKIFFYGIAG